MTDTTHLADDQHLAISIAAYNLHASAYQQWASNLPMAVQLDAFTQALPPRSRILDAGCGPGRDLQEFRSRGYAARGIDAAHALVAAARDSGLEVDEGDFRTLPYPDSSFEGVWACASLVHLTEEEAGQALREFHRVLRPGGVLYTAVKAGNGEPHWAHSKHGLRWFWLWDTVRYADTVAAAGFTVRTVDDASDSRWIDLFAEA